MDYKYLILFLGTLSVLVAYSIAAPAARPAEPEYDEEYDDAGAGESPATQPAQPAPKPSVPVRHGALLNRRNPLVTNGRSIGGIKTGQATATTSTTQAPALKEEEFIDENEEELPAEVSSTTESPKKLKTGIIRPFRSNDDLLAALKRRREQAAGHKSSNPKPSSAEANEAPAPVETSTKGKASNNANASANGGRRRYSPSKSNNSAANEAAPPAEDQPAAPVRTGRRFGPRS